MLFKGVWAIVKGFLDEKTKEKIKLYGTTYKAKLLEVVDEEQLASFLGGKNEATLLEDKGPWNDYEVVDGHLKDDIVGIKKKGEENICFTM